MIFGFKYKNEIQELDTSKYNVSVTLDDQGITFGNMKTVYCVKKHIALCKPEGNIGFLDLMESLRYNMQLHKELLDRLERCKDNEDLHNKLCTHIYELEQYIEESKLELFKHIVYTPEDNAKIILRDNRILAELDEMEGK